MVPGRPFPGEAAVLSPPVASMGQGPWSPGLAGSHPGFPKAPEEPAWGGPPGRCGGGGALCAFSAGRTSGPALGPPSCGLAPSAAVRGRPHTSGPVSHVPGLPSRSLQKQEVDLGPKLTPPASNVSSIYKKTHKFHL